MSLLDDIVSLLEAEDVGDFGETIFGGDMPDSPDDLIVLYETPSSSPTFTKSGMALDSARLQVLSRAEWYRDAMQKALDVYAVLGDYRGTLGNPGTQLRYGVRALQRPFDVGARDGNGRTIVSCNYTVRIY